MNGLHGSLFGACRGVISKDRCGVEKLQVLPDRLCLLTAAGESAVRVGMFRAVGQKKAFFLRGFFSLSPLRG